MSEELVQYQTSNTAIEAVIAKGDLGKLTPQERVNYYIATCRSLGLNELTKPFDYITLNGKLTLYPTRTASDQLRKENGVSISEPVIEYKDDLVIVRVNAVDKSGRTDSDIGAVFIGTLKGADRANAIMKAITKAKRRVTLSICGLGWADESEIETIPNAQPVTVDVVTGEIVDAPMPTPTGGNGKAQPTEDKVENKASKKLTRADYEARFGEIVGQLAALGQDVNVDEAWVHSASDAELIAEGKRLAGMLATAQAAQATLPLDGAE